MSALVCLREPADGQRYRRDSRVPCRAGVLVLAGGMALVAVRGQDLQLTTFETGGPVLASLEFPAVLSGDGLFHFQLGFETDEPPAPGFFADSFTVSLLGTDPQQVLTVATVDTFGLIVAPSNPGGLMLDPSAIHLETAPWLASPKYAGATAYDLTVSVPVELLGQVRTVALDFFDNQNGVGSRGLAAIPAAAVPEPGALTLLGFGGALVLLSRRRGR